MNLTHREPGSAPGLAALREGINVLERMKPALATLERPLLAVEIQAPAQSPRIVLRHSDVEEAGDLAELLRLSDHRQSVPPGQHLTALHAWRGTWLGYRVEVLAHGPADSDVTDEAPFAGDDELALARAIGVLR